MFEKRSFRLSSALWLAGFCGLALLAGALLHGMSKAEASSAEAATPPPDVEVITLKEQQVRHWSRFPARLEAVEHVQIRPRVSGTITEILFTEGTIVPQGAPLFVIDPRPYQAELARAKANLAVAHSEAELARIELDRAKNLLRKKVVSNSRFDTASNAYHVALAQVDAAEAALTHAALNLEYAHIQAPVTGRISRAEITVGNVVQAGLGAPVLTSIVSTERLYAAFDVDEHTYLHTVRQAKGAAMPVELHLPDEEAVTYYGTLHAFDNQLDTASGTIRARAVLENSDGALVPGMYANVRLGSGDAQPTLLLREKAIRTDQDKKYVYIVTPEGEITYREVTLGRSVGGKRVIQSGLAAEERVLVNSLQRVRPGMKVNPVEAIPLAAPTP